MLLKKIALHTEILLFASLSLVFFLWFGLPLLWSASENVRLVEAFMSDEGRFLRLVKDALEAKTFKLHFVSYGHFFFNLVLVPLNVLQNFMLITEQHIMIALRLVSWVFGYGTVVMCFVLVRKHIGQFAAWASGGLLMVLPLPFLEYCVAAHPDTMLLFFITLSLYYACQYAENDKITDFLKAVFVAGLAFSAKYPGLFLLPCLLLIFLIKITFKNKVEFKSDLQKKSMCLYGIMGSFCLVFAVAASPERVTAWFSSDGQIKSAWIVQLITLFRGLAVVAGLVLWAIVGWLYRQKGEEVKYPKMGFLAYYSLLALLFFTLAFVLTSPNSLVGLQFVEGMIYESGMTTQGGFFDSRLSSVEWLQILGRADMVSFYLLIPALLFAIFTLFSSLQKFKKEKIDAVWILSLWSLVIVGYFMVRVRFMEERYILPAVPYLLILGIYAWQLFFKKIVFPKKQKMALVLTLGIFLTFWGYHFLKIMDYRYQYKHRVTKSKTVQVGEWLAANVALDSFIYYDATAYIPPIFQKVRKGSVCRFSDIQKHLPDIIVLQQSRYVKYGDATFADRFLLEKEKFADTHACYNALMKGTFEAEGVEYIFFKKMGETVIFRKEDI